MRARGSHRIRLAADTKETVMSNRMILTVAMGLALVAGVANAGGRARVSVTAAPKQVIAGRAFDVVFLVRPELGMTRDRKVEPTLRAVCGDQVVTIDAVATKSQGEYKASLTLPSPGDWSITIDSRYCQTVMDPFRLEARPQSTKS
jgi:hypothetical protein